MLLSQDPGISVVAEAADERQAVQRVAECRPDVVLLEAGLTELVQELDRAVPNPPAAVVYGIEAMTPERLADLVRGNVRGVVHRAAAHDDVIHAVHAVLHDGGFASPELTGCLLQAVRAGSMPLGVDHRFRELLTERENGVLSLLCQGLSNKAIAAALCVTEKTVKFHVSNVLAKSGVSTRAQLIAAMGSFTTAHGRHSLGAQSA
ncbi:response regulator transcription factor [Streptomyces sp. NK08204]|uniref:response regulator transcription factor n=1 Tax=Streptomyces sp. NK08204 TaxID=2873260 RepID=UPI001CEC02FF|nr:response regulator transcription factor [Streptomyces sp. NK08204]